MSEPMVLALIAAATGVATSSGLWAFIQKKNTVNSAHSRLLRGLAYDKIVTIGMAYIERGWVSRDEYEEYYNDLVVPYKEVGGNGVAEKVAAEVGSLPFRALPLQVIRSKKKEEDSHASE